MIDRFNQDQNVSEVGKGKLTVGKVYAGLLILESWKTTRFGKIEAPAQPVSYHSNNHTSRSYCFKSILTIPVKGIAISGVYVT